MGKRNDDEAALQAAAEREAAAVAAADAAMAAENAAKERAAAEAAELVEKSKPVRMKRNEPVHPGGPTTADVHPDEVGNMEAHDWKRA